jgi:hypothetical protein
MSSNKTATATLRRSRCEATKNGEIGGQPAGLPADGHAEAPTCLWPTAELVIYRHSLIFELGQLLGRASSLIRDIWNLDRTHETTKRGEDCGCWEAALQHELPSPDMQLQLEIHKFGLPNSQDRQKDAGAGSRKI